VAGAEGRREIVQGIPGVEGVAQLDPVGDQREHEGYAVQVGGHAGERTDPGQGPGLGPDMPATGDA